MTNVFCAEDKHFWHWRQTLGLELNTLVQETNTLKMLARASATHTATCSYAHSNELIENAHYLNFSHTHTQLYTCIVSSDFLTKFMSTLFLVTAVLTSGNGRHLSC